MQVIIITKRVLLINCGLDSLNLCHIENRENSNVAVTNETGSYEKAQSNIVETNVVRISPSKTTSCFDGIGECELNYNEDSTSEHSFNSIPSLASEPEDTCLPFKLVIICYLF
jgi:hypothetical protein